ncbi:cupin domain-containing protein [Candidatus Thorarchaeota archaeon]|nr:MAG: cupin domain-containing protein [Candidatus Thorarchaeota archaeon]
MYTVNYKEREVHEVDLAGSKKTTMRWLIGKSTGAKSYAMRYFEIQPGGIIPEHNHDEEHEIFVLQGEAKLIGSENHSTAKKDDVVFISSNEPHGYDNRAGNKPFSFICVIPLLDSD